jgi:hypothetical protein
VGTAFGSSVGSGLASVWEGSGGFERITAADAPGIPVFDNTPSVSYYGPGEAPWEGQYLGQWQEPASLSYAHTAFDGALVANVGRYAGVAGTAFIDGVIGGAEIGGMTGNPVAILGGALIGGLAATGAYLLLNDDHPTGHFESAPPKLGSEAP